MSVDSTARPRTVTTSRESDCPQATAASTPRTTLQSSYFDVCSFSALARMAARVSWKERTASTCPSMA